MEPARIFRSAQWTTIALLLAGCSAGSSLFGSTGGGSDGVGALASNGSTIADAVSAITGPSDSYCRKGPAESSGDIDTGQSKGMIPIYKVEAGDCAAGDTAIKSYEYNDIKAKNEQIAWAKLHAAAQAEAAKPTYCRTATSHSVYRASGAACQPGEEAISEEEYSAAKSEAAAAATKLPSN